jgi:phosphate transport system protein
VKPEHTTTDRHPAKRRGLRKNASAEALTQLVSRACLIAKDAAFNVQDYIENSSNLAFVAVRQCEKELDEIERQIDQSLPSAITDVSEPEARQLLACLKFITDLERIGDLLASVAHGVHQLTSRLPDEDSALLVTMASTLQTMLEKVHDGFIHHDVAPAKPVLQTDSEIDRACHKIFRRHFAVIGTNGTSDSSRILFIAQAFERAGDHAKNLAEEIIHLVRGQSLRHASRGRLKAD